MRAWVSSFSPSVRRCAKPCVFGEDAASVVLVSGVQALRNKSRGRMYFMVGLSTGRLNLWFQTVSVVYR